MMATLDEGTLVVSGGESDYAMVDHVRAVLAWSLAHGLPPPRSGFRDIARALLAMRQAARVSGAAVELSLDLDGHRVLATASIFSRRTA